MIQNDAKMKKISDNNEIIKSNGQPKNLKHLLTNAKFTDKTIPQRYPLGIKWPALILHAETLILSSTHNLLQPDVQIEL